MSEHLDQGLQEWQRQLLFKRQAAEIGYTATYEYRQLSLEKQPEQLTLDQAQEQHSEYARQGEHHGQDNN